MKKTDLYSSLLFLMIKLEDARNNPMMDKNFIVAMPETIDFIYYIFEFHFTKIISKLIRYVLSINFISDTTYLPVPSLLQVIQAFR
jgi:hypothetical protein